MTWQYYVSFIPPQLSAGTPLNVLRKMEGDVEGNAQEIDASGQWGQSWVLLEILIGKGDHAVELVTREQAAAFAHAWHAQGLIPQVPEDLAS